MAVVKNETVIANFYYTEDVTRKNYDNIMRKALTVGKNSGYTTTVSIVPTRHEIQVIFTFQNVGYKFVDEMRGTLNRFIDSHKEVAAYQWASESVLVGAN